jgi:MYXO-CTERM domain-containing protein
MQVDPCQEAKATKSCMPPGYYGGLAAADGVAMGTAAGGDPVDKGESDNGAAPPTAPKPTSSQHNGSGPGSSSDPDDGSSNGDSSMKSSSGCAVSAPGDNYGLLGFLSMLGLSVLALRRRKA